MLIEVKDLPSGYKPYPENTVISIRPLKYGEVLEFNEYRGHPLDILKYAEKREIISGIAIDELTVGDWQFLELTLVAASYATPTYTIKLGKCPECEKKYSKLPKEELYFTIGGVEVSKIPDVGRKLVPADISFIDIAEEVESPVMFESSIGEVSIDFYRIKHYKVLLEDGKQDSLPHQVAKVADCDLEDLELDDYNTLVAAFEMMSHGMDSNVAVTCHECEHQATVKLDWGLLQLIPFARDKESARNRIHFGKSGKPQQRKRGGLPSGESTLRPSSRTRKEKK